MKQTTEQGQSQAAQGVSDASGFALIHGHTHLMGQ